MKEFMFLAAHDLRAPLMSVKGILNLIKIDPEKKNLDQYFMLLEHNLDKMNQSINDIVSYSSSDGRVKVSLQEIELKEIAVDALESLYFTRGAEHVRFRVSIDDVRFISDYKILYSIFSSLITHAIRYRDPNKDSYLRISATSNSEGVELVFEDNGMGLDESVHDKVFDKYFLGNREEETGPGLYMIKNSLDLLDGRIQVQSAIGQGTTFTIQIPILIKKE